MNSCNFLGITDIILGDDTVNGTEEDIFEIILEWIWQNQEDREPCFAELFRHVRLSSISSQQYLYTKLMCHELVQGNGECRQILMDEMSWRALYAGQEISPLRPRPFLRLMKMPSSHVVACRPMSVSAT